MTRDGVKVGVRGGVRVKSRVRWVRGGVRSGVRVRGLGGLGVALELRG